MPFRTYAPQAEGAVNAFDPAFAIAWPLPVTVMSDRDKAHPMIDETFKGVAL